MVKRFVIGTRYETEYGEINEITSIEEGIVTVVNIKPPDDGGDCVGTMLIPDTDFNWEILNEAVDSGDWKILAGGPEEVA